MMFIEDHIKSKYLNIDDEYILMFTLSRPSFCLILMFNDNDVHMSVRLCLPFPCVSTPLYGPSCFLSLVNSSPSVFDLLLT